jgi:hypothetical protein
MTLCVTVLLYLHVFHQQIIKGQRMMGMVVVQERVVERNPSRFNPRGTIETYWEQTRFESPEMATMKGVGRQATYRG